MANRVLIVNAFGPGGSAASRLNTRLRAYERVEVAFEGVDGAVDDQTIGVIFTGASGPDAKKPAPRGAPMGGNRSRRGGIDAAIRLRRAHPSVPVGVYATGVSVGDADDAADAGVAIEVQLDALLARLGLVSLPPQSASNPPR
jgi:hypothetical protein